MNDKKAMGQTNPACPGMSLYRHKTRPNHDRMIDDQNGANQFKCAFEATCVIAGYGGGCPMENNIQNQTKCNYTICPVCGVHTKPKHATTTPDKVVRKWICANPACGEVRTEVEGR
ncbi:hypothetical protein [Desulfoluna spongiiphila]|uniref:hypothetical protein n=1 Tax=Desulfoluna spongiiphila TaxID=419481 RepID=UPI0012541E5A|nr:hypothetical protein [Desulfoluna spongiiphila]VVS95338.1 hypothetical protein DBB_49150 [Desulfoluna spongiiphila]